MPSSNTADLVTMTCSCGEVMQLEMPQASKWLKSLNLRAQCDECEARDRARQAEDWEMTRSQGNLSRSHLPNSLRGLTFDTYDTTGRERAVEAAREWARGRRRGLLLCGPVGVGKTRLAATAVCYRLRDDSVRWVSVAALIADLTRAWKDQDRAAAAGVLTGTGALALDDLDKLNPTEYAVTQLYTAIDQRVIAGAPLIATTNLSPNELEAKLGEPIASRLAGYCDVFRLSGRDRRLDGKA